MIQHAERLYGVKPQLVAIVLGAGVEADFVVTCGLRSKEDQAVAVATGRSQTMHSNHLTGDAVDLAVWKDGRVSWDFEEYVKLSKVVKAVALRHGVKITWGGDWHTLKDGPHFELVKEVHV
jgi:peptidoglycan L-alanyl-D-glutamate endopeptidase CwlK